MTPDASRQQWANELKALIWEARKRGDKRSRVLLLNDWLNFRKGVEGRCESCNGVHSDCGDA